MKNLLIALSLSLGLLGCFVSKENNLNSDRPDESQLVRDTLNFMEEDSVRIIYTYKYIGESKILKAIHQEKKIDISGNGKKVFRIFQEIYFHDDGTLRAITNNKGIKVAKEDGITAIHYDQDYFSIDEKKEVTAVRITKGYFPFLDLFSYKREGLIYDMTQGNDGVPVYDYNDSIAIRIIPLDSMSLHKK